MICVHGNHSMKKKNMLNCLLSFKPFAQKWHTSLPLILLAEANKYLKREEKSSPTMGLERETKVLGKQP